MPRQPVHVHFETRANKHAVFRMTEPPIVAARTRNAAASVSISLGDDPRDRSWLPHATGLVTSNDILREPDFPLTELANHAPRLRWIHIIGAGIEPLLPLDWLPDGAVLTNNSGVHVEKARESATMALLMLHGGLPALMTQQRRHLWRPIFTPRITGRRLLVVGVGDMGGAVAAAGRALGLRVTGVRRSGAPHPDVEHMATPDALDALLPQADLVALAVPLTPDSRNLLDYRRLGLMKPGAGLYNVGRAGLIDHVALAVPLTPDSRNLLDYRRLGLMKPGAGLYNVGRAGLIDHVALAECLTSGAIGGAILDVFDPEPLPADSPLWDVDSLVVMPHVTSDDLDAYLPATYDLVFANALRLAEGETLLNCVEPERGY
jgi:phosphoglycerate dehydrogenase-like enzyme